jgi:hypothetical protein
MPEYRVLVEITQTAWYYVEADSEAEAMANYPNGNFGDYGYEDEQAVSAELV